MSLSAHPAILYQMGSKMKIYGGLQSTFGFIFMDSTCTYNTQAVPNKIVLNGFFAKHTESDHKEYIFTG